MFFTSYRFCLEECFLHSLSIFITTLERKLLFAIKGGTFLIQDLRRAFLLG